MSLVDDKKWFIIVQMDSFVQACHVGLDSL